MTTKVTIQNLSPKDSPESRSVEVCEYVEGSDWYGPKINLLPDDIAEFFVYEGKILLVKEIP